MLYEVRLCRLLPPLDFCGTIIRVAIIIETLGG